MNERKEQQTRWIKEKTNWDIIQRELRTRIKLNEMLNAKNEEVIAKQMEWLNTLHSACTTLIALVEQDHEDRKGMFLMGANDNNSQKR